MRKRWSGVGNCRSCTATVALTFELELTAREFPRAVLCPMCNEAILLNATYTLLVEKDTYEETDE